MKTRVTELLGIEYPIIQGAGSKEGDRQAVWREPDADESGGG